jgi:hypothetical protein
MSDKQNFIETINVLKNQYEYDTSYCTLLEKLIQADSVPPYDNSKLINHIMGELQKRFPAVDGQCEIERYCYELNFGYADGKQVITPKDLWYALVNKQSLVVE